MLQDTTTVIGQRGEELAQRYLEAKGLRFVDANWSCKLGEIDLIMQDGPTRVFVEVRTRQPTLYGEGTETVMREKQKRVIRTTKFYQQQERYWDNIRFDVVSIILDNNGTPGIEHIEDAFEAEY